MTKTLNYFAHCILYNVFTSSSVQPLHLAMSSLAVPAPPQCPYSQLEVLLFTLQLVLAHLISLHHIPTPNSLVLVWNTSFQTHLVMFLPSYTTLLSIHTPGICTHTALEGSRFIYAWIYLLQNLHFFAVWDGVCTSLTIHDEHI